MAGARTGEFDIADHLGSPDEIVAYLDAVLEEGDDKLLLVALRTVVKSRGFAKVAQWAGLRRETLYQSFSEDGNPRLSTLHSVLGQLGMRPQCDTTGEKRLSGGSGMSPRIPPCGLQAEYALMVVRLFAGLEIERRVHPHVVA